MLILSRFFVALAALLVFSALESSASAAVDTQAQYAYMIDYDTGQTLLAKQADVAMHPSSMSKLMTVYVLFQRIKEGRATMEDMFPVSEKAWRTQGSKTFVHVGDKVKVEDLLQGIVVQSGNDACIVVAEGLSGSEEAFAQAMNAAAAKIGLTQSHFANATGLPDDHHLMSVHDLVTLAHHIIAEFPDYYHYFSEPSFTYNRITQGNRNRLLGNDIGVDGLKTGHTEQAGYGIVLSAKDPKSGRRLVLAINGLESEKARIEEGDRLLRWGLREFTNKTVAKANAPVGEVEVWFGDHETVKVVSEHDVAITLPASGAEQTTFKLVYDGPVSAPVAKGTQIATLMVQPPGLEPLQIPLVAAEDVGKAGFFSKLFKTTKYFILHRQ